MKTLPLKKIREASGRTQEDMADAAGISVAQVSRIENGKREPRLRELQAFAKLLRQPLSALTDAAVVPIVGCVSAGGEMILYEAGQGPFGYVQMPPNGSQATVAVEINGDSLGAAFNGWVAFFDDRRDPVTDDLLGKLCVAAIDDGRVVIKKLARGRQRGCYDLYGSYGDPIQDARLRWAAEVLLVMPKHEV